MIKLIIWLVFITFYKSFYQFHNMILYFHTRKDFLVFNEVGKNFLSVTNHGYDEKVMLCLSQDRHYDSVYTKQFISNAAFCQCKYEYNFYFFLQNLQICYPWEYHILKYYNCFIFIGYEI